MPCGRSVAPCLAAALRFLDGTNPSDSKMQTTELPRATLRVAASMDSSGRAAADETNHDVRVEKRSRGLDRIACHYNRVHSWSWILTDTASPP